MSKVQNSKDIKEYLGTLSSHSLEAANGMNSLWFTLF